MSSITLNFPKKKYNIIYADPPWQFQNYNDETSVNWVGNQYPLMTLHEICSLPVSTISDKDCALFLWATFPTLDTAFSVINAWGFTYKTVAFVWVKTNEDSTPFLGMGYWTRSNAEICLLATKGQPKRIDPNVFQVVTSKRKGHSQKPAEVRKRIVQLLGNLPKIELFARERLEGWDSWGNQLPNTKQVCLVTNPLKLEAGYS